MNKMNIEMNKRIIFLDYLRVFAFVSVLIGHKFYPEVSTYANSFETHHITQQYLVNIILSMFTGGGAGVIVFFMISGYIVLHVLQSEQPVEFMIKRVFRIYPLLIIAIFVEVFISYVSQDTPISLLQTMQQMSLFGDFFNTPHALLGVEWTLRIEILFYILMFLLSFSFLIKRKNYSLLIIFSVISIGLYYVPPLPLIWLE